MDLSPLKGVFHMHFHLKCLELIWMASESWGLARFGPMASIEWIMMVPNWSELFSLGAGGSEPFKGLFPRAFPSKMFRTDLDGF